MKETIKIAGDKTRADWAALKAELLPDPNKWEEAFDDYFRKRLTTRYFDPISRFVPAGCDGSSSALEGEGFAAVAILCSLIEFLETCRTGSCFELGAKKVYPAIGRTGYKYGMGVSSKIFCGFLTEQLGLSRALATDFYANVRCAILHDAMTVHPWVIRVARSDALEPSLIVEMDGLKILNRDVFLRKLEDYVTRYRVELLADPSMKEAFIRKFDSL